MTIYLYCLTDTANEPAADLRGLGGSLVRSVPTSMHSAAWVSDLPSGLGPATAELARVHDRVVRAALSGETPLPARFGQTFAGEDALLRALAGRSEVIARALERVRGGVEMTIRILLPQAGDEVAAGGAPGANAGVTEPGGATGGRLATTARAREGAGSAYMAGLRDRQHAAAALRRQADFLQSRVARAVDGIAREELRSPLTPGARSLAISHLVARQAVCQYRLAVNSVVASDPALRLLISGPWAPYSFARIADA